MKILIATLKFLLHTDSNMYGHLNLTYL